MLERFFHHYLHPARAAHSVPDYCQTFKGCPCQLSHYNMR